MIGYPKKWELSSKQRLARALFHIGRMDETMIFRELINSELERLDREQRQPAPHDEMLRRQGACLVLEDLQKMFDGCEKEFETFKQYETNKIPGVYDPNGVGYNL